MSAINRSARAARLAALAALFAAAPASAQGGAGAPGEGALRCAPNVAPPAPASRITPAEICATIAVLAHDSLEGRRAGTEAGARAARWIAERFAALGLRPLGAGGSYLHPFTFPAALLRDPHAPPDANGSGDVLASVNVAGVVPGTDPARSGEAILVGAHYDHLGRGGVGSLAAGDTAVHNGADDNASGVAGVLELAQWFAAHPQPRALVFAAFGAEELGNIGSRAWVEDPPWPLAGTIAMINLDMVGRLRETLEVHGTGTSPVWGPLLDSLAAGPSAPRIARVPDGFGPSDHASFYGAGVPVLAWFTGAHDDYHRPGDDLEGIDPQGEVRVLELVAQAIAAAADGRAIPWAEAPVTRRRAAAFRVGLGVVPDYGHADGGLRIAAVRPDGPAAAAGLRAGDLVLRLAGEDVTDVYGYMEALAGLEPGVPIQVTVQRGTETFTAVVTPAER